MVDWGMTVWHAAIENPFTTQQHCREAATYIGTRREPPTSALWEVLSSLEKWSRYDTGEGRELEAVRKSRPRALVKNEKPRQEGRRAGNRMPPFTPPGTENSHSPTDFEV